MSVARKERNPARYDPGSAAQHFMLRCAREKR
jgi:hypothetical protein